MANNQVESPRILESVWGRIEVEELGTFKDVKLWPGGGRAWDWGETGTAHTPGIQFADVEELIEKGAQVVILSQGHHTRLLVPETTLEKLRRLGIEVHAAKTGDAVALYNDLRIEKAVGGLFHSTC